MYKKTHLQSLIISVWICCFLIIPLFNIEFIIPSIIFLIFGFVGLYFTLFVDSSIQQISRNQNGVYIKYQKGIKKQEINLKNEEIQKLVCNFYIKASTKQKGGFYNFICFDITILLNSGEQIQLHDDYVMNGFMWHVGKNVKQINSVKTLVNMFKGFEKFSYNIKKIHAIYDKRFDPEAIKAFINN